MSSFRFHESQSPRQSYVAYKVASKPLTRGLAAAVFLAGLPRYVGLKAIDTPMLMRMEVDDAVLLKDKPVWHSCEQAWVGLPCNTTDSVDDAQDADVKSHFQLSRFVGELLGLILATVVLISSESAWRKRGANEKLLPFVLPFVGGPYTCDQNGLAQSKRVEEEIQQQPEQELQQQAQPSQDELNWISSARSGKMRLTEDVYKAAVQWWLQQPLADIVDRLTPQDQKLLKPVLDLTHRGHDDQASLLMEQIGRLDKLERDVRRPSAKHVDKSTSCSSPLSRSTMNTGARAALMRKAIESHVTPAATSPRSDEKVPHWHVPQKTSRSRIKLGEHPLAGLTAQHSSRRPSDSQPLRRSSQDSNQSLYEFGCACGA